MNHCFFSVKKILLLVIFIAIAFLLFSFFQWQNWNEKTIMVGGLYTLSGDYAEFLQGIPAGVNYALTDFRIKHPEIQVDFFVEDDQSCNKATAVTGIRKLIDADRVQAVVGVDCSGVMLSVAPIAQENKVIIISGMSSAEKISELGDFVFRTYPTDKKRSDAIAKLILDRNYSKAAFVFENENDAVVTSMKGIAERITEKTAATIQEVSSKETDFRTIILKIKNEDPDVIVFGFTGVNQNLQFIRQLKETRMEKPLFTPGEIVQNDETLKEIDEKTELVYAIFLPDEKNPEYKELGERYSHDKNKTEMPQYLAESYDATMITLEALFKANGNTETAKELMLEIGNNYAGKSGTITFDKNGDVDKPPLLMTIKNKQFVGYETGP